MYTPIARNSDKSVSYEYDGDSGDTLRFGDDVFASIPERSATFQVTYRFGGGLIGNVAADSITSIDPSVAQTYKLQSVTNPLAASGGAERS